MKNAIEIKNLNVSYNKENTLDNLSLAVNKGEFVYIIGPNGGGKTTLIKTILGIIEPINGEISILGKKTNIGKRSIGYVPQNSDTQKDFPITVSEVVETAFLKSGLNLFKIFGKNDKLKAMEYLKLLGVDSLANAQIGTLSGGEFQRVLIARALARDPEILILDEPCANTDPVSSQKIHEILDSENQKGVTVIIVSHDINHVLTSKRRTVFINKKVLFDDIVDERVLRL